MFGDKVEITKHLSRFLQEIRDADKAEGQERIYIQGEKAAESKENVLKNGVPLNEKTLGELREISIYAHTEEFLPELLPGTVEK